jgi:hypothetical protein
MKKLADVSRLFSLSLRREFCAALMRLVVTLRAAPLECGQINRILDLRKVDCLVTVMRWFVDRTERGSGWLVHLDYPAQN